jgi:hypothetical protein
VTFVMEDIHSKRQEENLLDIVERMGLEPGMEDFWTVVGVVPGYHKEHTGTVVVGDDVGDGAGNSLVVVGKSNKPVEKGVSLDGTPPCG